MASCCGNLQGTLHSFLSFHVGKVEVEGTLLFVKLLAGIDKGGLVEGAAIEETDDIGQTFHPKHLQLVHHRRFTHIVLRHNQPLELLLTGTDGDGEHTADRLQLAVESQLTNHHIVSQHRLADLSVGCEDADGQRQVVAAAFFPDVGWREVDGEIGGGRLEAVVGDSCTDTVITLLHGCISQA